ncbi:prosaposin [Bombina bombina]|uniref:prosaposin n=1 Tax=Bombina bombina TaxID=8345 RepID=UPI00235A9B9E|nr:prosaposin [Bombina bombina]XP_053552384.1 prosaposin [Bombina bombina]
MKLLVVLSCVLVAVAASPLLGKEQCSKGPEVWCENVQTASQCGAVKHCQQTVWNKPTVKTIPCEICKEIVTVLGNFLKDNTTQSEIEQYLDKACAMFPDPTFASQCKQMVNEYIPLLMNILQEETSNPGVLCCSLGLCKSLQRHLANLKQEKPFMTNEIPEADKLKMVYPFIVNVPQLLFPQDKSPPESKNGDVCKDCLQLIGDVQDSLRSNSSFSKKLIENALKDCDVFAGGFSDMCKNYINQYADIAIQMFLQMPAQQICSYAGFCAQEAAATPLQLLTPAKTIIPAAKMEPAVKVADVKSSVSDSPQCVACELIIKEIDHLLENNRTEDNIRLILEKVCYVVPKSYRQQCIDLVDAYTNALVEILLEEVSPHMACCALGLCSAKQPQNVKLSPTKVQGGGYCDLCKMAMNYVVEFLEKKSTEQQIESTLEKVCNFMPEQMQDECRALISEYEPLMIQLLLEELDSNFVCQKLHLCQNAKRPLLGNEKCMWGPSYWCKDLETAALCNTIEHCRRHVWD